LSLGLANLSTRQQNSNPSASRVVKVNASSLSMIDSSRSWSH